MAIISVQVRELQVLYKTASKTKTINLKSQGEKQVQLSISYIGIKMGLSSSFQGVGKVFLKWQKVTILGFVRPVVQKQPKTTCK